MDFGLTVFFLSVVIYALTARRLERWLITMPIFFVAAGTMLGDITGDFSLSVRGIGLLTEVTLALLLFADAATIGFRRVARDNTLPDRLLLIGLPLSMLTGGLMAYVLFPGAGIWYAFLLAAILTPTDAALGLAIFNNENVPARIRRALNVESGLNDGIIAPFVALFLALALSSTLGSSERASADPFVRSALLEIGIAVVVAIVVGLVGGRLFQLAKTEGWSNSVALQYGNAALALVAFVGASAVGGNGFIAAFAAGLLFGHTARQHLDELVEFTEVTGTLLSLFVWTVFGANIVMGLLRDFDGRALLFALLALTVMRMAPVFVAMLGSGLRRDTVALMGWFGPRGLASVVFLLMALEALHGESGHTGAFIAAAGWTILLSVVLHGVSAQPLAGWYARRLAGLSPDSPELTDASTAQSKDEPQMDTDRHG